MRRRAVIVAVTLAVGCGGPDTLHYELRDPHLVTVYVDGQPVPALVNDGGESPHYDNLTRTGDDTVSKTGFTLEHTRDGIFAKWDASLPMLGGERLEIVGNDGWVAALPLDVQRRTLDGQAQLIVTPGLELVSTRHAHGWTTSLHTPQAGDHVVTLSTPRDNVIAVEQRGDHSRVLGGGMLLALGSVYSIVGSAALAADHRNTTTRVIGSMFATVGATIDVIGIYELARGKRHRSLPLP